MNVEVSKTPKNVQGITDAEFYIWLKPICTFEKYANVALKIRHLDPVKGIFVSWKHSNVILYPRGYVDQWKPCPVSIFGPYFFHCKQYELRILWFIVVQWSKWHFFYITCDLLLFAHLSRPWSIGWVALSFLVCSFIRSSVRPSQYGKIRPNLHFFQYILA